MAARKRKGGLWSRFFSVAPAPKKRAESKARPPNADSLKRGAVAVKPEAEAPKSIVGAPKADISRPVAAAPTAAAPKAAMPHIIQPAAQPTPILQQFFDELNVLARNPDTTIGVDEAARLIEAEHPVILDVRPPDMFRSGHLPGAVNAPLAQLKSHLDALPKAKGTPILVVCQRGNSSLLGMIYLRGIGHTDVRCLTGGTQAWKGRGLPVET